MLYKLCGSCGSKISQIERCVCSKQRHKKYDREQRDKEMAGFYNSKAWKRTTALCKSRANGLDLYEWEVNKNIVKGTLSHHIEELGENRERALDVTNLIWVSDKTHALIHAEYHKGLKEKQDMQSLLFFIVKNIG